MKDKSPIENQGSPKEKLNPPLPNRYKTPDFKGKNIPFLSNISEHGLADLMRKAKTIKYVRKENTGAENITNSLFVIFYGKVHINRVDGEKNKEVVFQIHEPTNSFGEIAVLTDELRSISQVTLKNTVFIVVSKIEFNNWLIQYIDVKFAFLPVL